jgi:hypothetical protein
VAKGRTEAGVKGEYRQRDPATAVVPAKRLADNPAGAPDLETAAELLRLPLAEIERAAEHVTPWPDGEDPTLVYWSLRQLARHVAIARGFISAKKKPAP